MAEILILDKNRAVERVYPSGTKIKASEIIAPRVNPGPIDNHEADHAIGHDGDIIEGSSRPNGNVLGYMKPKKITAAGLLAPAGMNREGIGADLFMAKIFGMDINAGMAQGRTKVLNNPIAHFLVACALAENDKIGPAHVKDAYAEAKNIELGIRQVRIEVTNPEGKKKIYGGVTNPGRRLEISQYLPIAV